MPSFRILPPLSGILLLCAGSLEANSVQKPNILFLFADDQRADTIHALGNAVIKTPNLDRLVHSGMSFNRAYMQGAKNSATCVPSRAMLLSGQSLFRIDEKLMRDPTWPQTFGSQGYTTFVSGKWHNGDDSIPKSFQIARSMFTGGMTNPMVAPLRNLESGKLSKPEKSSRHACEVFADEAVGFLKQHREGPFLCYIPFDAPHDPHIVPKDFPIEYEPSKVPLPSNFLPQHPFNNGELSIRDELLLPTPRTPEAVQSMLAEYYRYISYLDAQIGRILDALADSPHAQNTIVVFSADSGVARGSHGLIGKQNLYEHSLRVPLIISGPGIPKNVSTQALCYLFDVFPTLGAVCGIQPPSSSEGIDFSKVLRDPNQTARPHLNFAFKEIQQAACNSEWKLIHYPKINKTQLFNLKNDPAEKEDVSQQTQNQDVLQSLLSLSQPPR